MRIGILVGDGFEDSELMQPCDALRDAGHEVVLIGTVSGEEVTGKRGDVTVRTDVAARDVHASELDALVIPGGWSPDHLRTDAACVRLVRDMFLADKPLAAVCHGPSLLVEAGVLEGRTVTSWPSIRTDLLNAGARVVEREVCVDGNLITSRKPEDLAAFSRALLEALAPEERPASYGDQLEAQF
jgi:protease I